MKQLDTLWTRESSTIGVAAVKLKMKFLGSEVNDTRFLVAKRISEALERDN